MYIKQFSYCPFKIVDGKIEFLLILLTLMATGCGSSDSRRATVRGQVALDGQPLEHGSISFIPKRNTKGPLTGAVISAGKYHIAAEDGPFVGSYKIEIRSAKKTGKQVKDRTGTIVPELIEAIPPQYNTGSALVRDISKGANELDFDLQSRN